VVTVVPHCVSFLLLLFLSFQDIDNPEKAIGAAMILFALSHDDQDGMDDSDDDLQAVVIAAAAAAAVETTPQGRQGSQPGRTHSLRQHRFAGNGNAAGLSVIDFHFRYDSILFFLLLLLPVTMMVFFLCGFDIFCYPARNKLSCVVASNSYFAFTPSFLLNLRIALDRTWLPRMGHQPQHLSQARDLRRGCRWVCCQDRR